MRIIRFLTVYIMVSVLGLIVAVFLALNHYPVQIDLIKGQYSVNVAWVMLGAAVFGGVITMLALLPGRIATGLYARTLARDVRGLDRDVVDLEQELEDYEEQRAHMLEQYEILLERHERMLARHEALLDDHSETVAERDQVRAQLAALRIARPAAANGSAHGATHGAGAATALRLLPQTPQAAPAPAARPITPLPAARVAQPVANAVADKPARVEPAKPPIQRPITPSPLRVVAATPQTPPTPAPAAQSTSPTEESPEPTTVPVVSAPVAMPVAVAARPANTPPTDEPPTPVETNQAKDTATALPSARRNPLPQLQAGVDHAWQSAGVTLVRMRQQTQQRASALWGTAETQVASQRVRLGQLWRRLAATNAASGETDSSDVPEADD